MSALPSVTLAIEWDNARDASVRAIERHLASLEAELARTRARFGAPPAVAYLFDPSSTSAREIERALASHAPKLGDFARVSLREVAGADYFTLKAEGIRGAESEVVAIVDCDTAIEPGWLEALLAPFSEDEIVATTGFSFVGIEGFLSRAIALAWIFRLESEARDAHGRNRFHANNFAVRTSYFRAHPWSAPAGGKKGLAQFLRDIEANGKRWLRCPDARLRHAPHKSAWQFVLRGWQGGAAQDWSAQRRVSTGRAERGSYALRDGARKGGRALARVVTKRRAVGLPLWQVPAALALAAAHWGARLVAQLIHVVRS